MNIAGWHTQVIDCTFDIAAGPEGLKPALESVCAQAEAAVASGAQFLMMSDRNFGPERAAIPILLVTGAVHHRLVSLKQRSQVGLLVETGEVRGRVAIMLFDCANVDVDGLLATFCGLARQENGPAELYCLIMHIINEGWRRVVCGFLVSFNDMPVAHARALLKMHPESLCSSLMKLSWSSFYLKASYHAAYYRIALMPAIANTCILEENKQVGI